MITVDDWVERYRVAWEERDADAAAALFAPIGTYRNDIFNDPNEGPEGVHAYWTKVTEHQSDVSVQMGRPIVGDERTAVEWWTQMKGGGADMTITGCLLLRFDDEGLCTELEEYFNITDKQVPPHDGWGR